ncbi:hypothetical protein M0R45_000244 [Rubus argutus]|uniref:Uncharacterized protein n=1 Tax=Rubus argutus TaxID=59490 RepID=A0AAW1VMC7_RUBAR
MVVMAVCLLFWGEELHRGITGLWWWRWVLICRFVIWSFGFGMVTMEAGGRCRGLQVNQSVRLIELAGVIRCKGRRRRAAARIQEGAVGGWIRLPEDGEGSLIAGLMLEMRTLLCSDPSSPETQAASSALSPSLLTTRNTHHSGHPCGSAPLLFDPRPCPEIVEPSCITHHESDAVDLPTVPMPVLRRCPETQVSLSTPHHNCRRHSARLAKLASAEPCSSCDLLNATSQPSCQ